MTADAVASGRPYRDSPRLLDILAAVEADALNGDLDALNVSQGRR